MNKKIFTIDDIEKCLNELGFEWVDRYVFVGKNYEYAKLSYFKGKPVSIYIKRNNHYSLVSVMIKNKEFIIFADSGKLDASSHWQDLLEQQAKKGLN